MLLKGSSDSFVTSQPKAYSTNALVDLQRATTFTVVHTYL